MKVLKKRTKTLKFYLTICILLAGIVGHAQLIEQPIGIQDSRGLRVKNTGPIDLPFWDDFSADTTVPDTSLWLSSESGVLISPGLGLNAPSFNVAGFDGWDAFGNPYNLNPEFVGKTDSLVSRPIRLQDVPIAQQNTLFLTFYYQKKGNGEIPDEPTDSLVLRFKKADGSWNTVWPLPGETINTDIEAFTKKTLKIDSEYISNDFQFMFQAYGRQNGPFDTWNLDYVFLDKNRSEISNDAPDRAFTEPPSSILGQYTAMPVDHFLISPKDWLDSAWSGIRNLEDQVQPVEYNVFLEDDNTGQVVDQILIDSAFIALTRPFEFRPLPTNIPDSASVVGFVSGKDSVTLRTRYEMDSGDKFLVDEILNGVDTVFYENFDLRVNDTISSVVTLHDYYAYDDGTAEFGAGVNQLGGFVGYQFVPEQGGFITSIDIYFANIDRNQAGIAIGISLWQDLDVDESSILSLSTYSITNSGLNTFTTYTLPEPVEVLDTFYVAISQATNEFVAIGLDKNTDTGDKIFYNVTGIWEQNQEVNGSLMIRPRFGDPPVTGLLEDRIERGFTIFPNPVRDVLYVDLSSVEEIVLTDLTGKTLMRKNSTNNLDLGQMSEGVYIVRILHEGNWYSDKIIKR